MINLKMFTFSPLQENTYVLWNENKEALIIDPGCYFTAEQEAVQQFITDNQLNLTQLINTHCHLDHVFGLKWIAKTYNLIPAMHPIAEKELAFAPATGLSWGMPFDNYAGSFTYVNEGDTIQLGEDVLEVLDTPGHSPGSISFYCRKQGFIISGDVLFMQSIGRTDLPGGDSMLLFKTIREKLFSLPETTIVYSGHGPKTTIAQEKKYNPYVKDIG